MRFQELNGSCGAGMIVNICRAFGHFVSEAMVRPLARTTRAGTDERGVIRAFRLLGYTTTEFIEPLPAKAWLLLHGAISQGRAAGIAVDNDKHWVACVANLGPRITLVDSALDQYNQSENGIHFVSRTQLLRRWVRKDGYYAVVVTKGK